MLHLSNICAPPRSGFICGSRLVLAGVLALIAAVLAVPAVSSAGNWPGWRGPSGTGQTDEKDLPLTWGGKKNENVLWKVKVEGRSWSSPVVWEDRVFLLTADKQSDQDAKNKVIPPHHVYCYRATDGKLLWSKDVPTGKWPDGYYAIPTPVTDGKLLYTWFGSSVLAALDMDGKIVWRKERPGPYSVYPGVSSSPVLYGDTLLVLCDQSKDSFLMAVDKKTGVVKWETKRPTVRSSNSSPILIKVKDRRQLVVAASNALQGLDPDNGKVLWWCTKDGGYWTSLTYGDGLVYADSGGGRGVAVDPTGTGDVNKTHVKWQHPKIPEGLAAPLIADGYLYRVHKPGMLKCWKLTTGEEVYSKRLEGISFLASPFATPDGRLYFASPARTYVIKAGAKGDVLAMNQLQNGGNDGTSPAVSGGRIFLKSGGMLFCIGK